MGIYQELPPLTELVYRNSGRNRLAPVGKSYKETLLIASLLLLSACGAGTDHTSPPPPPRIKLTTLVPDYTVAGNGNLTVFVNGSGFKASSVVEWKGTALPTTFGTEQILSTTISGSLIALPGTAQITVKDGSTTSNSLPFGIASPAAATAGVVAMISVAPDGTPAGGDSLVTPAISATGRYVAFQSAGALASGANSGFQEIYERDTCVGAPTGCTPTTVRVTVTYNGSPVTGSRRLAQTDGMWRLIQMLPTYYRTAPRAHHRHPRPDRTVFFFATPAQVLDSDAPRAQFQSLST